VDQTSRIEAQLLHFSNFHCFSIVAFLATRPLKPCHSPQILSQVCSQTWLNFMDGSSFVITRTGSVHDGIHYFIISVESSPPSNVTSAPPYEYPAY
jgi:hypothetical protein